jgi:hypothetical protein
MFAMEILRSLGALVKAVGAFFVTLIASAVALTVLGLSYILNLAFLVIGVLGLLLTSIGYGGCNFFAFIVPDKVAKAVRWLWDWTDKLVNKVGG